MKTLWTLLLASIALAGATDTAGSACPGWMLGPFWQDSLATGANGAVLSTTTWNPTGSDIELVIGGNLTEIQGTPVSGLAYLDSGTGQWHSIPYPGFGPISAMAVFNNELVVAGGYNNLGGPLPEGGIRIWDGSSWRTPGAGVTAGTQLTSLTVYNGLLIVGGTFSSMDGLPAGNIAAWDGASWQALGSGLDNGVISLGQYAGKLVAGGHFATAGGVAAQNVAAWDGSQWSAMAGGLDGSVFGLQPFLGGIYAVAEHVVSGEPSSYIARWNGTTWQASPEYPLLSLEAITVYNNSLYVSGQDLAPANNVVFRYDGTLHQLDLGIYNGNVKSMVTFNGDLVVTGLFADADQRPANNIARWDGANWGTFGGGNSNGVYAITPFNGRMVFAGDFHQPTPTGAEANHIVSYSNGTPSLFGTGMDIPVTSLKAYTTGTVAHRTSWLVAGGVFTQANGVAVNHIARWSETGIAIPPPNWAAMGAGLNGQVIAIERYNNVVYAAGLFSASGSTSMQNIARFNETSGQWEALGSGLDGEAVALKVYGSYLYAGGQFVNAGGVATGQLARWDGSSWSVVGPGPFWSGTVSALEVHNNQLVIGGLFNGLTGSPNLVQFDGTNFSTLGTGGTDGAIWTLHSTGSRLYAGGDFASIGGVSASRFAYWDGSWHDAQGGADNSVLAIANTRNQVNVGGFFNTLDNGTFTGSPTNAVFDETGVPQFRLVPSSQAVNLGDHVTFTAAPDTGYTGLSLQWYRNSTALGDGPTGTGSSITGAYTENLNITNITRSDIGNYALVVSNACGSDTSTAATLDGPAAVGAPAITPRTVFDAVGPNPTSGPTEAFFSLAHDARVRLTVRDVAGRRVRLVDAGTLVAGRHQASWDARGEDGTRTHAGVYFVEIEVDGRALGARRLTLVR